MVSQCLITQVGNVHYSNAETHAYALGLSCEFVDNIRNERKDLTSPLPVMNFLSQTFSVAQADHSANFSPARGGQNSGRGSNSPT